MSLGLLGAWPSLPGPRLSELVVAAGPRLLELELAQQHVEDGDFEEAVKALQSGLNQPDLSDDQLVEIYRLLGLAQLYLGNEERARDAYERLLQARPDFELSKSEPPKIRSLYARIKDDIKKRRVRPVTLLLDPVAPNPGGRALTVTARIEDLALGAKAKLYFRRAGRQAYSSVDFGKPKGSKDAFMATVPAYELPSESKGYEMEYYVEVADAAQRRLAGKGDAFNPLQFSVGERAGQAGGAEESPWYKNPVVYIVGGALVAGATVGVVLLASQKQTGTLPITIRVTP